MDEGTLIIGVVIKGAPSEMDPCGQILSSFATTRGVRDWEWDWDWD